MNYQEQLQAEIDRYLTEQWGAFRFYLVSLEFDSILQDDETILLYTDNVPEACKDLFGKKTVYQAKVIESERALTFNWHELKHYDSYSEIGENLFGDYLQTLKDAEKWAKDIIDLPGQLYLFSDV